MILIKDEDAFQNSKIHFLKTDKKQNEEALKQIQQKEKKHTKRK